MDAYRIGIKLFVADASGINLEEVVPVFHAWIQQQALAGNLLIDVADYQHVPEGPGIVLVAHEANYATDQGEGKLGLLYQRKRPIDGSFQQRLALAFREALSAAWLLEQDAKLGGKFEFDTRRIVLRITDKLHTPNTAQTFEKLKPELTAFLTKLLGTSEFAMERYADERVSFEVRISTAAGQSVEALLARVQD